MCMLIYCINIVNCTNRFAIGESAFHCWEKPYFVIVYCSF